MHVTKLLAAAITVFAVSGPVRAADLPTTKGPPDFAPPPLFTWTGQYFGVNGGGAFGRTNEFDFTAFGTMAHHDVGGGFAGGTSGYNYQIGSIVLGMLGDADWASVAGSTSCPTPTLTCSTHAYYLGSSRVRIGYAVDRVLIYATGGLGSADLKYRTFTSATGADANAPYSAWEFGYVFGGGIEYALDNNWSVKAEYLYYGFGTSSAPAGTLSGGSNTALRTDIQTIKVGLNYKFDLLGFLIPSVAKY
jgi:outer membrane immunogenic protein